MNEDFVSKVLMRRVWAEFIEYGCMLLLVVISTFIFF